MKKNNPIHIAYDVITDFTKNFIKTKNRIVKYTNVIKQFSTSERRSIDIYISELEVSYDELITIVELYDRYNYETCFGARVFYVKNFSLNEAYAYFMQNYLTVCEVHNLADQLEKC